MPSYATDVRPIMLAHCVRCHGAGGTLQGDPDAYPLGSPPPGYNTGSAALCYLDEFDDRDCTDDGDGGVSANCKRGAKYCAVFLEGKLPVMPPPPATINEWERDVLLRWGKSPMP